MAPASFRPLSLALLFVAFFFASSASVASAQGYWIVYPNQCSSVCAPAFAIPSSYSTCTSTCTGCLLYWYSCYSSFYPYFSGSSSGTYFSGYNCSCYWPWWAWLLFAVGCFLFVCVCCPLLIICLFFRSLLNRGKKQETVVTTKPEENYVPGTVPAPDAYTVPPPGAQPAYPGPPAPGYPAAPAPQGAGYPPAPPPGAGYPPPPPQGY